MEHGASSGDEIEIGLSDVSLFGNLHVPEDAPGIVLFAHGSGSSRMSPRNRMVAAFLRERQLGTLLFDLLTREEERVDIQTRRLRFDIDFLAERLIAVTDWLVASVGPDLPVGYFGSSTGAAAAIKAAVRGKQPVGAIVSRGGRPDLGAEALARLDSPTLLIVGGHDTEVLALNRLAYEQMHCIKELVVIPGATHLFEEPGTLERAAGEARRWFLGHLQ